MKNKTGRYSGYIRPFTYVLDLIIINLFSYLIISKELFSLYFQIFITFSWVVIAFNVQFYEVYRFTKVVSIVSKIIKQFILFLISCYAFSGFYLKESNSIMILTYTVVSIFAVSIIKLSIYFFLRKYRVFYGGNFRNVVVVGNGKSVAQLESFFNENPDYGYNLAKVFTFDGDKKAKIEECFGYVLEHKIDEIYCSLSSLSNTQIDHFIDFADNNLKILKFLRSPLSKYG